MLSASPGNHYEGEGEMRKVVGPGARAVKEQSLKLHVIFICYVLLPLLIQLDFAGGRVPMKVGMV